MSMTVANFQGNITTDFWRRPNKKLFIQHHYQIKLPDGSIVERIRDGGLVGTLTVNGSKIKAHNIKQGGKVSIVEKAVRLQKIKERILYSENVDAGKDKLVRPRYLTLPKGATKVITPPPAKTPVKPASPKAPIPAPKAVPVTNQIQNLNNKVNNLTAKVNELEKRLTAETASKQAILAELGQTKIMLTEVRALLTNS